MLPRDTVDARRPSDGLPPELVRHPERSAKAGVAGDADTVRQPHGGSSPLGWKSLYPGLLGQILLPYDVGVAVDDRSHDSGADVQEGSGIDRVVVGQAGILLGGKTILENRREHPWSVLEIAEVHPPAINFLFAADQVIDPVGEFVSILRPGRNPLESVVG